MVPASCPTDTPTLLNPHERALPLVTVDGLRSLERAAAATLPANTLMSRAGQAAARFLLDQGARDGSIDAGHPVWIVAGPGNNGGDALVVAAVLRRAGVAVEVCMPVDVKPADARWALDEARTAGVPIRSDAPDAFDHYGWLVDGMFGIGLARPLDGVFATLAEQMSAHARRHGRVLALDVPSGLDSDTGNVVDGGVAVRATHTVTFIAAKPGLFTALGRDLAGDVRVAPLGIESSAGIGGIVGIGGTGDIDQAAADRHARLQALPGSPTWPSVHLNAPSLFAPSLPPRDFSTHKGTFGSLAVIGGDTGLCGAPILAARAALYLGAGKVHVAFIGTGAPAYDPPHPELMLHAADQFALDTMDALAIGCGMGHRDAAKAVLRHALSLDVPKLLDADALNLIAGDPELAALVTARGHAGDPCVLTPHPLEAARLAGSDAKAVQRDRLATARALADRFASVVVLKGTGTVIASPDGRVAVNPTGNAGLATGGTGDALGGMIGALLAQHLPCYEAALAGVYLHGLAADTLSAQGNGPAGLTAGELAPMVRTLMNRSFYATR